MTAKKRVLFIGTGGGNDVFSTTLAMHALRRIGWTWEYCAIAGVISPFHRHEVARTGVGGLFITTPTSRRHTIRRGDSHEVPFVDAAVKRLTPELADFRVGHVYSLSLTRGTTGLVEAFRGLAREFDYFVLVDVGGDIFFGGERDRRVLSPMFDAMVLRAFVDSGVPGVLFEAGPGTDGELSRDALKESLAGCGAHALPLDSASIDWWESLYKKHIEPVRPGRTVPYTIEVHRGADRHSVYVIQYRARMHVGSTREFVPFWHTIDADLCRNFYIVDPARIRNPFAVACRDPYDWFAQTQVAQLATNCEAGLEYFETREGRLMQFAVPSPLFEENQRLFYANWCLYECAYLNTCDGCWLTHADWKKLRVSWSHRMRVDENGPLVKISKLS